MKVLFKDNKNQGNEDNQQAITLFKKLCDYFCAKDIFLMTYIFHSWQVASPLVLCMPVCFLYRRRVLRIFQNPIHFLIVLYQRLFGGGETVRDSSMRFLKSGFFHESIVPTP